jgi:hypothetical protein
MRPKGPGAVAAARAAADPTSGVSVLPHG